MFQAYLITCLTNGKGYVGITSRGINRRWAEHLYGSRVGIKPMAIGRAIAKHGVENFRIETLCCARSWEDICAAEIILIEQWNTKKPHGYNVSDGGYGPFGVKHSAESIERSAAKHRGKPCHPNTRAAASKFHLGRPKNPETKVRMSAAKIGTIHSDVTKAKISASKMGLSCNVGTSNGQAKLTETQVLEARTRLAAGESQRSIARSFGIQHNAIWKIANGLKWCSVVLTVPASSPAP